MNSFKFARRGVWKTICKGMTGCLVFREYHSKASGDTILWWHDFGCKKFSCLAPNDNWCFAFWQRSQSSLSHVTSFIFVSLDMLQHLPSDLILCVLRFTNTDVKLKWVDVNSITDGKTFDLQCKTRLCEPSRYNRSVWTRTIAALRYQVIIL